MSKNSMIAFLQFVLPHKSEWMAADFEMIDREGRRSTASQ